MRINIPYGNNWLSSDIPDKNLVDIQSRQQPSGVRNLAEFVEFAINNPIASGNLSDFVRPGKKISIVVNDITRPIISSKVLPPLLRELRRIGVSESDITILIATGVHRPNTAEEQSSILGNVSRDIKVINHQAKNENTLSDLGYTRNGIPVRINRVFAESDVKILTGLISPHQQSGFAGGRKSVLPGIASYESIRIYHSFPICPRDIAIGRIDGNVAHQESLEAARMVGIDFIVNVVPNSRDEVFKVVAGELHEAWMEGVRSWKENLEVTISEYADITIASPGGYPRDINFWQSQKAIASAELITKSGGIIILVAQCIEGLGEENLRWFEWLIEASTPAEVIERFEKVGYVNGSGKAFCFARGLKEFKIMVVSEYLDKRLLQSMFFEKYDNVQIALNNAINEMGKDARIAILPRAVEFLPTLEST